MASTNWKRIGITVVAALLGVAFLGAGGTKLIGMEFNFETFRRFGYPIWFMYVTGILEVVGAILVLVPATRFYGAALLACVMLGASVSHLRLGEFGDLPPPLVLLAMAIVVAWFCRPALGARSEHIRR